MLSNWKSISPWLVTIFKTWLVCGMSVAVRSRWSLLLDVVTLKVGVPAFALLKATRTGEPIAMFAGGASTVTPLAAATATYTGTGGAVADGIGERRRERLRGARLIGRGRPGEGVRRRVEGHAGGQVCPARR